MDEDNKQELLKRADELIEENRRLREQLREQQARGRLLQRSLHRNPASEQ